MGKVPEPDEQFTIVTSQLLELVEIAIELEEHDPGNAEYWSAVKDAYCILLGDLAGKVPVIVRADMYAKVMDMRMEMEIERMFPEDQC